jgi:hypothetical protein
VDFNGISVKFSSTAEKIYHGGTDRPAVYVSMWDEHSLQKNAKKRKTTSGMVIPFESEELDASLCNPSLYGFSFPMKILQDILKARVAEYAQEVVEGLT